MELKTISQVTKSLNITTRMLRYYEQIGLIESEKTDNYSYRVYTEDTVRRIEQIIILRKLRISLKQIALILECKNATDIINTFYQALANVDAEIAALSTIRDIISEFVSRLNDSIAQSGSEIKLNLLDDATLIEAVDGLLIQRPPLKETSTLKDLQEANKKLNKLTDRDVRIVYLPPMTVASIHIATGEGSEQQSAEILDRFINDVNLKAIYPSARCFGFNNPDGLPDNDPAHGYERWISIPDDMEVPLPFVKKHLNGGIYAAHMIPMGAWDEGWLPLHEWVSDNKTLDFRWNTVEGVCGWLEEHLNFWFWGENGHEMQLDLLMPVKPIYKLDF